MLCNLLLLLICACIYIYISTNTQCIWSRFFCFLKDSLLWLDGVLRSPSAFLAVNAVVFNVTKLFGPLKYFLTISEI